MAQPIPYAHFFYLYYLEPNLTDRRSRSCRLKISAQTQQIIVPKALHRYLLFFMLPVLFMKLTYSCIWASYLDECTAYPYIRPPAGSDLERTRMEARRIVLYSVLLAYIIP